MKCLEVNVAVHVHSPADLTKAVESLSRVITGLALDGLEVSLAIEDPGLEPDDETTFP